MLYVIAVIVKEKEKLNSLLIGNRKSSVRFTDTIGVRLYDTETTFFKDVDIRSLKERMSSGVKIANLPRIETNLKILKEQIPNINAEGYCVANGAAMTALEYTKQYTIYVNYMGILCRVLK